MNNSSLNTGLLLVIVIVLIAGGFWYLSSRQVEVEQEQNPGIEITLPEGNDTEDSQ